MGVILAEYALHPKRRLLSAADETRALSWAQDDDATLMDASITTKDGVLLKAWYLRPEEWNGSTVIVQHGLRDNRLGMTDYADIFLLHGYAVLLPDARAHGMSGGALATYGLLEREDLRAWMDWLLANEHPVCIFAFGESMGAAQVLQTLKTAPPLCAVAAECPFATFRETSYDRMGQAFHTGPWLGRTLLRPVVESSFLYTRWRYHLDMNRVSPEDAVSGATVPVLLVHGQSDTNIPVRHSKRILIKSKTAVLWEIRNTGHSNAIDTSPKELENKVVSFFEKYRTAAKN